MAQLTRGLDDLSEIVADLVRGYRFTAVDEDAFLLLDWNKVDTSNIGAAVTEALLQFHSKGQYLGAYPFLEDALGELEELYLYQWDPEHSAWVLNEKCRGDLELIERVVNFSCCEKSASRQITIQADISPKSSITVETSCPEHREEGISLPIAHPMKKQEG